MFFYFFFFSSRRRHTRSLCDWSSDVCSSDLAGPSSIRFGALQHRDYRRYFVLILLSAIADNIEHVISYWVIFQAFHSPTLAGFAVISHWVPFLLFSVYAGALADRFDCR